MLCEAESAREPTGEEQVHHTPEETGDTAREARARRLVATHIGRFLTPGETVARASARFDGPVDAAAPGSVYVVR